MHYTQRQNHALRFLLQPICQILYDRIVEPVYSRILRFFLPWLFNGGNGNHREGNVLKLKLGDRIKYFLFQFFFKIVQTEPNETLSIFYP